MTSECTVLDELLKWKRESRGEGSRPGGDDSDHAANARGSGPGRGLKVRLEGGSGLTRLTHIIQMK